MQEKLNIHKIEEEEVLRIIVKYMATSELKPRISLKAYLNSLNARGYGV